MTLNNPTKQFGCLQASGELCMKTKKDNELLYLTQFKQVFNSFPTGEIREHESPDFLVDDGKRKVGIEVTKIFKTSAPSQPPLQAIEATCRRITDSAAQICEERKIPPLTVSLHFIRKPEILKVQRDDLSLIIADFVCNNIPKLDTHITFENRFMNRSLPDHIHAITIGRFNVLTKSHFNAPSAGRAQREFSTVLQQAIDLKNSKLIHYHRNCDEYWLLIICEGSNPSSFFECDGATRDAIYKSNFDRSFFMEAFSKYWWELKAYKQAEK